MRRLYTWLLGMAGGAAAYRVFRRRPRPAGGPAVGRAGELRAKLAEAREAGDDRESFEAGETPVDQAVVPPADDLDARRRSVHEQARGAIDEMQGD
jgi:hypothetical protein